MRESPVRPATAVPDLAGFLAGEWRLRRRVRDRAARRCGRLVGAAHVESRGGTLHYRETGTLSVAGWTGTAEQRYRFELRGGARAHVAFADGRPFHVLDLSAGLALVAHDCPPDAYRGRYVVSGADAWRLSWRVLGPRKNIIISTLFVRRNKGENT